MKNARWLVDPDAHERQRLAIVTWNMDNPSTPARDRATRRQFEYHQQHGFMPPPTKTFGNGKYYKMLWNIGGQELIDRHQAARDAYYAGRPLMPEPDQRLPYCTCGHPRGTHNFRFVYGEGGHYEACRITACGCNSYLVA